MYDAYQANLETKAFESYLIIRRRIEQNCKNQLHCAFLLEQVDQQYLIDGSEEPLMDILRSDRN